MLFFLFYFMIIEQAKWKKNVRSEFKKDCKRAGMRKRLIVFIFIFCCMQLFSMEFAKNFQTNQVKYEELEDDTKEYEDDGSSGEDDGSSGDEDDNLGAIPIKCVRDCFFCISKCVFGCLRLIKE